MLRPGSFFAPSLSRQHCSAFFINCLAPFSFFSHHHHPPHMTCTSLTARASPPHLTILKNTPELVVSFHSHAILRTLAPCHSILSLSPSLIVKVGSSVFLALSGASSTAFLTLFVCILVCGSPFRFSSPCAWLFPSCFFQRAPTFLSHFQPASPNNLLASCSSACVPCVPSFIFMLMIPRRPDPPRPLPARLPAPPH